MQGPRWAVLATHSQAETWAEANLRQRGYTAFLPRYSARKADPALPTLTRIVVRPLFPGYVFAQHDPRDPWRPLRYCPGVRANLLGGSGVQYARSGAVEALQAGEEARRHIHPPTALWRPGMACRPRIGVFAGLPACVTAMRRPDMAMIAVMFLGELREVLMPTDCIEARDAG